MIQIWCYVITHHTLLFNKNIAFEAPKLTLVLIQNFEVQNNFLEMHAVIEIPDKHTDENYLPYMMSCLSNNNKQTSCQ